MIPTGYGGGALDVTIQVMPADSIASEFRLNWQDPLISDYPLQVAGSESGIEARLTLELDAGGRILYSKLKIERVFPGGGDVILERDWEPRSAGRPGYYLVPGTPVRHSGRSHACRRAPGEHVRRL